MKTIYLLLAILLLSCKPSPKAVEHQEITKSPVHTLVIHGGAGSLNKDHLSQDQIDAYTNQLTKALNAGYAVLDTGGSSTKAVITAIQILETSPLFNAGVGAVFTNEAKNELDASIMEGETGLAGAVAGVTRIKSPIEAAYTVMTQSPHVMMSGPGAEKFARQNGLDMVEPDYFFTEKSYNYLQNIKKSEANKKEIKEKSTSSLVGTNDSKYGTVGAVALDKTGNLSAGTSTGGMTNKRFGRIGDSPVIGAGTYANNQTCAVSATGHGEYFIRNVVAHDIAARMKYQNKRLEIAAPEVIRELKAINGNGGVITLDANGNISMPFNTPSMLRGFIREKGAATVFLFGE